MFLLARHSMYIYLPLFSSVPQVNVLEPILFLIFINDLPKVVNSIHSPFLYANDVKVVARADTLTTLSTLQSSLDCVTDWAERFQLRALCLNVVIY